MKLNYYFLKRYKMGCACVIQEQLISKDLDLISNDISRINHNETKDVKDFSCKTKDISLSSPKKSKRRRQLSKNKSNETLDYIIKSDKKVIQNDQLTSGPIITLLKKTVDNYNRKNKKKIVLKN